MQHNVGRLGGWWCKKTLVDSNLVVFPVLCIQWQLCASNRKHAAQDAVVGRTVLLSRSFTLHSFYFPYWPRVKRPKSSVMSAYTYDNSPGLQTPVQDNFKASYDDLLDDNAIPFAQNAHHQTFAVDTIAGHIRGPSVSHSHKTHFSAKQSDDLSRETSRAVYPPQYVTKEIHSVSLWRKVRKVLLIETMSDSLIDTTRICGLPPLRTYSAHRNGN